MEEQGQRYEVGKFDPASSVLKPAETPAERDTLWKRLGFWFVKSDTPAPMLWIGIPSWLPVFILFLLLLFYFKRSDGSDSKVA